MDEDLSTVQDTIEKFDIKLKSKPKDGVILQLHHTVRGASGERRRIRFIAASFEDTFERLACADNIGNLFILDFSDLKFWKLTRVGTCSAMLFVPNQSKSLVVATSKKNFDISFLDIENGSITATMTGHTAPVKHISFSCSKTHYMLTGSAIEAILWELRNYTKYFTLNTYEGAQIQQIMFTPANDYLVACFQNDTIQIWKHETMKSVKQIIPSEMKHMKSIAFTLNGRAMAMGGLSPILILFSMDTWKALKSLNLTKYNITGVQQLAFIPQQFDGGSNKILAALSSSCTLHIFDLNILSVVYVISPESSSIKKLLVSPTGKYFLCILQLGEVNIYNASQVWDIANIGKLGVVKSSNSLIHRQIAAHKLSTSKAEIEQKMRICMDSARLRRILMQYGEYPDKFRSIIWRALLNIPRNRGAYTSLVEKGIHSSYKDLEKKFTIHSSITLKNLKRLLSCLAHWCPLFGVMKFMPAFVFPFVKVLQKDPLLLFETVATILINYCQLWFEYAPFPPISILAMIENILAEHDQQLLDHFCQIGITSQTYALKVLQTAFSEVLTCTEWLILWDHILSNEPAYILMVVISYNIVQRNALRKLTNEEQIDAFFHRQNPIDKKAFIKKAYILLNDTSEDIHPRKFFNSFVSLERGYCYQQFTSYPKATICLKLAKRDKRKTIKTDKNLNLKDLTAQGLEKEIKTRLEAALNSDVSIKSVDSCASDYDKAKNSNYKVKSSGDYNKGQIQDGLIDSLMEAADLTNYKRRNHLKPKSSDKALVINNKLSTSSRRYLTKAEKKTKYLERDVRALLKTTLEPSEASDD